MKKRPYVDEVHISSRCIDVRLILSRRLLFHRLVSRRLLSVGPEA